jgi:hypothetical protein
MAATMTANQGYPRRPSHPDFWTMSEAVISLDAAADTGTPFEVIMGDHA